MGRLKEIHEKREGMLRSICLTFFMMFHLAVALAEERPVVRDVAAYRDGDGARIEIRADKPVTYNSYLMPELAKWVIDLPGAASAAGEEQSRRMRTAPLTRISVRQKEVNGAPLTRIGLDFSGEVEFSVSADPLDRGRLVVLLKPVGKAAAKAAPTPLSPGSPQRQSP